VWINKPKIATCESAAPRSEAQGCHRADEMSASGTVTQPAREGADDRDWDCQEPSTIMCAKSEEVLQ